MVAAASPLVILLLAAQVGPPQGPDSIVWLAARAVSGDSADVLEARWQADLAQDPANATAATLGLAALAFYTFQYDDALTRYRALAVSAPAPDPWTVRARLGVGHVMHRRADLIAADSQYASAARDARLIADSAALADALINLALVRARTRGLPVARELFDQAAAVLPGANDRQRALHRCARGVVFIGDEDVISVAELEEGERTAAAAGEPSLAATCVFGRAAIHMVRGATDSVLTQLDRVIELQRSANDRYGLAGVLQRRSWYQRAVGAYAEASATLAEALEHAAVSGNASVEAWASIDLANISLVLRDRISAVQYSERARKLFEQQNDRWGLGTVSAIRAQLSLASGDVEAARDYYRAAVQRQVSAGDNVSAIGSYQALAEIALRQNQPDTAAALLASARALAESGEYTGWEQGLRSHEAALAIARGDAATARRIVDGLLVVPHQPTRRYALRVMRALTWVMDGDLEAAETEMLEAGNSLDVWRMSLDDRQFRIQAFQPQETSRGAATVIAALAAGGRVEAAVRLAEQRRARELLDRIVLARAMDDAAATGTAPSLDRLPTLDAWRGTSNAGDALLYFVTGDAEPTTLVLVTHDTALARIRPPIDSLAPPIDRYRALIESGGDARAAGAELAVRIFDDVLDFAARSATNRLIIIADGPLHRVPFASLVLSDGRYAVERFTIATAPSARVAMRLAERSGDDAPATMLAMGDPDFGAAGSGAPGREYRPGFGQDADLPRLAASGREARRVARYAAVADVRTGDDASESWLRSAPLGRYDILHFATHAVVDEQSITRTALVLAPGDGEDGFMGSGELSSLELDADLVVLSACRSAGGVVLRGEGIHGLTAPLLEAGTRAIVATQWQIADDAVVRFVDDFYAALAEGLGAAAALQSAQRSAIAQGVPPALWAAFTLVGDPDVTLVLRRPGMLPAMTWVAIMAVAIAVLAFTWSTARRDAALSASNEREHGGADGP